MRLITLSVGWPDDYPNSDEVRFQLIQGVNERSLKIDPLDDRDLVGKIWARRPGVRNLNEIGAGRATLDQSLRLYALSFQVLTRKFNIRPSKVDLRFGADMITPELMAFELLRTAETTLGHIRSGKSDRLSMARHAITNLFERLSL